MSLRLRALICVPFLLAVACSRLTPDEQKLTGTWEYDTGHQPARITFLRNHTYTLAFTDNTVTQPFVFHEADAGSWRLAGPELACTSQRDARVMAMHLSAVHENEILYDYPSDEEPYRNHSTLRRVK